MGMYEILSMVQELKDKGLQTGRDFDFAYYPPVSDEYNFSTVSDRYTVFTFHTDLGKKYGSLFALRWS
jgi:hypothetical protein